MKLDLLEIKSTDVGHLKEFYSYEYDTFKLNELGEHYKLVRYLSGKFSDETLLDIGTREGISALSMAPTKNKIVSYDILPRSIPYSNDYPNVELKQLDINLETKENLLNVPFMLLDVDPHDGRQESVFLSTLRAIGYKGLVVLDDISINNEMRAMWEQVPEAKYDLTPWAHNTGTGLIDFSEQLEVIGLC